MKMHRIMTLVIALPVMALGAGVVAGMVATRLSASNVSVSPLPPADRTPLVEELGLNPQQRDQMKQIWETARSRSLRTYDDAVSLQKKRDDALVALLNDEQKTQFEKISRDYADRFSDLTRARDQEFTEAVRQTKELLNEQQKLKYEQILRSHVGPSAAGTTKADLMMSPPI